MDLAPSNKPWVSSLQFNSQGQHHASCPTEDRLCAVLYIMTQFRMAFTCRGPCLLVAATRGCDTAWELRSDSIFLDDVHRLRL